MASSPLSIRAAESADLPAVLDVRARSFGPLPAGSRSGWDHLQQRTIDQRRALVATSAGRVVAYARINAMQQLWGGRPLPMAGVAGVVVAPEHRGRGVGTTLLSAVLERAVELGDCVSALYPATLPVYRRLGWEWGGVQHRVSVDTELLRRLGGSDVHVRRAGPGDEDAMLAATAAVHAGTRSSGPLVHSSAETREELEDASVFGYVADDGMCLFGWLGDDLLVHELTAGSESTMRALWSVIGSGSSVARTVHAYQSPRDPVHLLLGAQARAEVRQTRWMLRVLDLPAAVAGRGFPPGLDVEVPLVVHDPLASRCSGSWLLGVSGGRGTVARTAADGLRVGPHGLAAMFAGNPVAALRMGGVASHGRPEHDALLDSVFAAEPYLLDYF
ncbi:MAG: GNAT family N-acetyltransferase [Nocardioidaceae bacterium]|nr:GNAT family N-acetyltransferase [Nocardioidaceae bacterium]